ncbi:hypothetical protein DUI87_32807 [Hirundo rustica rustica]|uniref:Retroviral nucleocapsid Gag protein p24 C-terminal domain-containing protein n=1 Tax=Hirundo rustica rustica TaxID=333673 RepID=A0A3M0IPU0_HIRRU|nr:hypothetical protein DUI87_32807 [Hirundo rustica rustica]
MSLKPPVPPCPWFPRFPCPQSQFPRPGGEGEELGTWKQEVIPAFLPPLSHTNSQKGEVLSMVIRTPSPKKRFKIYAKLRSILDMKVDTSANILKASLARNPIVPFDLQRNLLPELRQNPETAVNNNNFPILLEYLCGDGERVSALKQAQEIPLLPSEPFVAFVQRLTSTIELQAKEEGAQEQVLEVMVLTNANEKAAILSLSMELAPTLHDMLQVCARKVPCITAHQSHSSRVKPPQKAAAVDTVPPVPVPRPPPKRRTTCLLRNQAGDWASQCPLKGLSG